MIIKNNIVFSCEEQYNAELDEIDLVGKIIYNNEEIVTLPPIVGMSFKDLSCGYYDYDDKYIYLIRNNVIISMFDINKKELISVPENIVDNYRTFNNNLGL